MEKAFIYGVIALLLTIILLALKMCWLHNMHYALAVAPVTLYICMQGYRCAIAIVKYHQED